MADISGGALSFRSNLDNDQLNSAIEETMRRIQGMSDAVVGSGETMDATTAEVVECIEVQKRVIEELEETVESLNRKMQETEPSDAQDAIAIQAEKARKELLAEQEALQMLEKELQNLRATNSVISATAGDIENTFRQIDEMYSIHTSAVKELESDYAKLAEMADKAFMSGNDEEYVNITKKQDAIRREIAARKELISEIELQADALSEYERKQEENRKKTEENANAHVSFRTQLRNVREEMLMLEQAGKTNTDEYRALEQEAGRLAGALSNVNRQTQILGHNQSGFQGVISGISGMSGALSAATGTVSLFADKNEDLQQIMLKVQSLMAITIGLQQVQQMLHEKSAFSLIVLTKAKNLFSAATFRAGKTLIGFGASANVARFAATALMATLTLGLSAAITGIIYLFSKYNESQEKAKEKIQERLEVEKNANATAIRTSIELKKVTREIENFNGSRQDEIDKVKQLNSKYGETFGNYKTLAEWYDVLIKKGQDYIMMLFAQAKAQDLIDKAVKADEKLKEIQATPDEDVEGSMSWWKKGLLYFGQAQSEGQFDAAELIKEENKKNKEKRIKELEETIEGYKQESLAEFEKANELIKSLFGGDKNDPLTPKNDVSKIADDVLKQKAENRQKEIELINDADERQLAQIEFNYDREIALIKQKEKEWKDAQGGKLTDIQTDILSKAENLSKQTKDKGVLDYLVGSFDKDLSKKLNDADSLMDKLNIIEQERKKLANDGSELDKAKNTHLDKTQREIAKEETDALVDEYSSYLARKIKLEEQFTNDMKLLQARRNEATTDAQREELDRVIANRKKQYEQDNKSSGDVDYDFLLKEYATFEEKKQNIIDDFDTKRQVAQEQGNQKLIEQLDKAQAKALSNLAIGEMQANPDWEKMFGNLDEISTKKLQELLDKINGMKAYLGVDFDPKDLEVINDKVKAIQNEIRQRNPFKALVSSIKDYGKAVDDESKKKAMTNMFEAASGALNLMSGALDAVVGGMEKMGVQMDEETQAILEDIGGILDGASQLAEGIATSNPLSIIQGSIGLLSSAFDLFNSRDRRAEKQIKKHAEAIGTLERAYNQLSWAVDKALGGEVYKNQQAAIKNMKDQRYHLQEMWRAEESKKKTDKGKVNDYKEQYAELGRQIEDMLDAISNDILQTDAKSFANELGDALVSAFSQGESAAKAFETTVDNVLKNAVMNQLKKTFLEKQLQGALDGLEKSMGYWNGDDFIFDGLTDLEIQKFKNAVSSISNNFNQALGVYEDLFKEVLETDPDTSLTGAVKGVTEETASLVAGQMNAIRINQMEATAILREQLMVLNTIASNTSYNHHLAKLDKIVSLLEKNSGDTLRSQGLS